MFTPAMSASSTSAPFVISEKACSTQVDGATVAIEVAVGGCNHDRLGLRHDDGGGCLARRRARNCLRRPRGPRRWSSRTGGGSREVTSRAPSTRAIVAQVEELARASVRFASGVWRCAFLRSRCATLTPPRAGDELDDRVLVARPLWMSFPVLHPVRRPSSRSSRCGTPSAVSLASYATACAHNSSAVPCTRRIGGIPSRAR